MAQFEAKNSASLSFFLFFLSLLSYSMAQFEAKNNAMLSPLALSFAPKNALKIDPSQSYLSSNLFSFSASIFLFKYLFFYLFPKNLFKYIFFNLSLRISLNIFSSIFLGFSTHTLPSLNVFLEESSFDCSYFN